MKFTSILAIAITLTAAIAAPAPITNNPNTEQLTELEAPTTIDDGFSTLDLESSAPIQSRALTKAQCKTACDKGADAVEAFCRRLPKFDLRTRAACWAASTAVQSPLGQRACVAFCDAWF